MWTTEEARNNTVVTGLFPPLNTEQTKERLLISSTLRLDNFQPVIDKWENHTYNSVIHKTHEYSSHLLWSRGILHASGQALIYGI